MTAPDASRVLAGLQVKPTVLAAIKARWTSGRATLLVDDAAAAGMGRWLAVDGLPSDIELAASEDFLASGVTIAAGLGWLDGMTITTRLLPEQRWGQVYRLVAAHATTLGIGVDAGTALEFRAGLATARGLDAAVVLDGRTAKSEQDPTARSPRAGSFSTAS